MANPALKAAVLLTDKRTWKAIGVVVAAVLTPFLLLVVVINCSMLSGTASHNNAAVELTFYGGSLPITMPSESTGTISPRCVPVSPLWMGRLPRWRR